MMISLENIHKHPRIRCVTGGFEVADRRVFRVAGNPHGERRRVGANDFDCSRAVVDRRWRWERTHYVQHGTAAQRDAANRFTVATGVVSIAVLEPVMIYPREH
jgi:hypothetical protein